MFGLNGVIVDRSAYTKQYYAQPKNKARAKGYRRKHKKRIAAQVLKWYKKNKERRRFLQNRWAKKNREKIKAFRLKSRYGVTTEKFFEMLREQHNCCAVCAVEFKKTPYVDHDHKTGAVRGLLCSPCNFGIGLLKDSIPLLKTAISYLRKSDRKYENS